MTERVLRDVNVNPCHMCMPMGGVLALKGIEGAMVLLHGSQGCSTYMRRHISTHFNEPMDIASSSLTEKGTVYGGEENLKQGLKNLLHLYNPEIVGILTTCLAETIGEDTERFVKEFAAHHTEKEVKFVTIPTPAYGGSQYRGYYRTLRGIVDKISGEEKGRVNGTINVIAANQNPADIRRLKEILQLFDIDYNLLPDISRTLDAPYYPEYRKIPPGGTPLQVIKRMSSAEATLEFGLFPENEISPGRLLREEYNIPLYQLPLPVGLNSTDRLLKLLSRLTEKKIPEELKEIRGRLLDAMIDAHKHNAGTRAAIFGQPELVYAAASLCAENGIFPAVVATGTEVEGLEARIRGTAGNFEEQPLVLTDVDFYTLRQHVKERNVNLLLGHSGGSKMAGEEDIPLVRIGFPVHDRMGAQRREYTAYRGTMNLLDRITNSLLSRKYRDYREEMFAKYHLEGGDSCAAGNPE